MSSIRKIKKAIKKSNGFFSVVVANPSMVFCASEWQTLKYHKKGISVDDSTYLPYGIMRNLLQ